MTPEERRRAGLAVAARIHELGTSIPAIAEKAHLDPTTVRALVNGTRWPTDATRDRINDALSWPRGEIARRAVNGDARLHSFTSIELIAELYRRGLREDL